MEEIARVYAGALFAVAMEHDRLDAFRDELGAFCDELAASDDLQVFFFSPYFSTEEKKDGLRKAVSGASDEIMRFLEMLLEKQRLAAVGLIRTRFDALWAEENRMLEVTVTSAVELGQEVLDQIGGEVERQTDRRVNLNARVDEGILGGLVVQVGNRVADASIRHRLDRFHEEFTRAA